MKHLAKVTWEKQPQESFTDNAYSRVHNWEFDGGATIQASSSPHIVPIPFSNPDLVDPEEAFLAAAASCHMLFFLSIAASQGYQIMAYNDQAEGILQKNDQNQLAFAQIALKPEVVCGGEKLPDESQMQKMHEQAHERCFIAQSIKASIKIFPTFKTTTSYERLSY